MPEDIIPLTDEGFKNVMTWMRQGFFANVTVEMVDRIELTFNNLKRDLEQAQKSAEANRNLWRG